MPGVKDWLKKASSDLKASKKLSDDDETWDCAVYHTHQCAEKSLKAFIVRAQQAIPKTHDLGLLLARCMEINNEFVLLHQESRNLDAYGSTSRYPNDSFYVDKHNVTEAVEMAEKILTVVKIKIG